MKLLERDKDVFYFDKGWYKVEDLSLIPNSFPIEYTVRENAKPIDVKNIKSISLSSDEICNTLRIVKSILITDDDYFYTEDPSLDHLLEVAAKKIEELENKV